MPRNPMLDPVVLPMKLRFGDEPTTEFKNNLDSIKVTLIEAPTVNSIRSYLVPFLEATWSDDPLAARNMPVGEMDELIIKCLKGEALPTALETINLVFLIEGISMQEVTHILRYRTASFSAECSGDKWWTDKPALVPWSIQNSTGRLTSPLANDDYYARYRQIVEDAKKLYCDMIDTELISIMDARYILPRCLETFYFMRLSLKDAIHFIKQRIDRQIQPETDNIIAYQMYLQLVNHIPHMAGLINLHEPSYFYAKMARTGKATNLYRPDADSDIFDWHSDDFIYTGTRSEICGTNEEECYFDQKFAELEDLIKEAEQAAKDWLLYEATFPLSEARYE